MKANRTHAAALSVLAAAALLVACEKRTTETPARITSGIDAGSPVRAVTSLTIRAPTSCTHMW